MRDAMDAVRSRDRHCGIGSESLRSEACRDADDFMIYDSASGGLYYDGDGAGGAAAVKFAQLAAGLGLSQADFLIV
jgi:Ca2+-binding RTX toxin-like protein